MHIQQTALRRTFWAKTVTAAATVLCSAVAWAWGLSPEPAPVIASQIGIEMVDVPAGNFLMGSVFCEKTNAHCDRLKTVDDADHFELPQHLVNIKAFQMAKTPVTLRQFDKFIKSAGRDDLLSIDFMKHNIHGDDAPVVYVSWDDAQAFIDWLNKTAGGGWRLPSEAEWEYACRAGQDYIFCGSDDADEVAWLGPSGLYDTVSDLRLHPVAQKKANAFGLHDMSGNVSEWIQDCWHKSYSGAPSDGSAWTTGCAADAGRVVRGGSWSSIKWAGEASDRVWAMPSTRGEGYGFRLARTYTNQPKSTPLAKPLQATNPAVSPTKAAQTPSKPKPGADACMGLHNGRFVRVLIKGVPLPAVAMVLETGDSQMTVRITEGVLAGAKQIRPCADARP